MAYTLKHPGAEYQCIEREIGRERDGERERERERASEWKIE